MVESAINRLRAATLCSTASASDCRVRQIPDADTAPGDLVLIGGADAARGRADLPLTAARLAEEVELSMVREDQMRLVADDQPVAHVDPGGRQLVDLGEQRLGVDDHAVADHARDAVVQDARRQQPQDELASVGVDRVPRVVSALIARDDREAWREQVDDLPFAFVAPLGAKYRDVHNRSILPGLMIFLDGSSLTLEQLTAIADDDVQVALAPDAARRIDASRQVRRSRGSRNEPVYGINTGFGALAETAIPHDALGALQLNLLRSHAAGVGEPLPVRAVRATMALRANVLAKGFSGIRRTTVEHLLALLNRRVHPRVPSRGSVGASGDLAPLAHLRWSSSAKARRLSATTRDGTPRTRPHSPAAGLEPVTLGPKEGLALINGTQPSTAIAALALAGAERLARAADVTAALSIDALRGSISRSTPAIHAARPLRRPDQRPPATSDACWREARSTRRTPHCGRVQDAYSLRCAPQVHGAARDALASCAGSSPSKPTRATDNPMVFADRRATIVSGGNFHGAPIALAADFLVDRARPAGDDQRAAVRSARQPGAQRPAGVPDPRQRPPVRAS